VITFWQTGPNVSTRAKPKSGKIAAIPIRHPVFTHDVPMAIWKFSVKNRQESHKTAWKYPDNFRFQSNVGRASKPSGRLLVPQNHRPDHIHPVQNIRPDRGPKLRLVPGFNRLDRPLVLVNQISRPHQPVN
jgi:hypothetical protein